MQISLQQVEKTASLAKLALGTEDLATITKELRELIEYAEILKDLPLAQVQPLTEVSRGVSGSPPHQPLSQQQVLALAPEHEGEYIKVPRVKAGEQDA